MTSTTGVNDGIGDALVSAKDGALSLVTDNVLYLLAVPAAFVAFRVGKRLIGKLA